MSRNLRIAFLHPTLGIGGAERLVVDAAIELQSRGHYVELHVLEQDEQYCFEETRDGSLIVHKHFTWVDSSLRRPRAAFTIAKMHLVALSVARTAPAFDVVICDLVSHVAPLLRLVSRSKILFYCHYPDRLLALRDQGRLYQLYRLPLDWLEALGMRAAHRVVVNSRFTASKLLGILPRARLSPEVLYPGVPISLTSSTLTLVSPASATTLLTLNRFGAEKNLCLAIDVMIELREQLPAEQFARLRLVIAGGMDARQAEQVETERDLRLRIHRAGLESQVSLRLNVTDAERRQLLRETFCFLYTPVDEHFGLGPIEAMLAGCPVIGAASGGLLETVLPGTTGFLCEPTAKAFAAAAVKLLGSPELVENMRVAGRRHAATNFSRAAFGDRLDAIVRDLAR